MKNSNGDLYRDTCFDSDLYFRNPMTVINTCKAGKYFSSANTDLSVPDAEGYPFSRVLFKPDGIGMPMEQSGVGSVHRIMNGNDLHTTRFVMVSLSDAELIQLFGDEAPQETKAIKSITIDPNNSASIEYRNEKGQVIATCLAYPNESETKFDIIDDYSVEDHKIKDTIDSFDETDNGWVASRTLYFTGSNNDILINYNNIWQHFSSEDACHDLCRQCDYELKIKVDNIGDDITNVYDTAINIGILDSCSVFRSNEFHKTVNVGSGEFRISYSLNTYTMAGNGMTKIDSLSVEYEDSLYSKYLASTQGRSDSLVELLTMLQEGNLASFYSALGIDPTTDSLVEIPLDMCDTLRFEISDCEDLSPCGSSNPDFESFFTDYWIGQQSSQQVTYTFLDPQSGDYYLGSMAAGEFNSLISQMLTDQDVNYNCEDLWNVWVGITYCYTSLIEPVPAQYGMAFNLLDYFLSTAGYQFIDITNNMAVVEEYPYKYFYYILGTSDCEDAIPLTQPYTMEMLNDFYSCLSNDSAKRQF